MTSDVDDNAAAAAAADGDDDDDDDDGDDDGQRFSLPSYSRPDITAMVDWA